LAFDLGQGSFEQVGGSPPPAVRQRVAQVNDERVEIVSQALGRGGVAAAVKLVDECLEPMSSVALAGGIIQCLPIRAPDPLAVSLGQFGEQVAQTTNGAVLGV
jgi:hypothetical protein